jgi:hypothetical protein
LGARTVLHRAEGSPRGGGHSKLHTRGLEWKLALLAPLIDPPLKTLARTGRGILLACRTPPSWSFLLPLRSPANQAAGERHLTCDERAADAIDRVCSRGADFLHTPCLLLLARSSCARRRPSGGRLSTRRPPFALVPVAEGRTRGDGNGCCGTDLATTAANITAQPQPLLHSAISGSHESLVVSGDHRPRAQCCPRPLVGRPGSRSASPRSASPRSRSTRAARPAAAKAVARPRRSRGSTPSTVVTGTAAVEPGRRSDLMSAAASVMPHPVLAFTRPAGSARTVSETRLEHSRRA